MTGNASLLFLGAGGELAQRLVVAGVGRGWRVHVVGTAQQVLDDLAQIIFDVIVFEQGVAGGLRDALGRDPDVARIPRIALLEPGRHDRVGGDPTVALEPECGLEDLLAFLVQSRDPAGPLELTSVTGRLEYGAISEKVRILEVRTKEIVVVADRTLPLPKLGVPLRLHLPWMETAVLGTCTGSDSATHRIQLSRELRLV